MQNYKVFLLIHSSKSSKFPKPWSQFGTTEPLSELAGRLRANVSRRLVYVAYGTKIDRNNWDWVKT